MKLDVSKEVKGKEELSEGLFLTEDMINSSGIITKKSLGVEVETQVSKQVIKVATWGVTALAFTIIGYIISNLWAIFGEVKELKGKYESPENYIEHISEKVEKLELENKKLSDSLEKIEIQRLNNEINLLKSKLK